jgi:hypothetical protein
MSNAFSGQRQFAQGPMMGGYGGGYGGGMGGYGSPFGGGMGGYGGGFDASRDFAGMGGYGGFGGGMGGYGTQFGGYDMGGGGGFGGYGGGMRAPAYQPTINDAFSNYFSQQYYGGPAFNPFAATSMFGGGGYGGGFGGGGRRGGGRRGGGRQLRQMFEDYFQPEGNPMALPAPQPSEPMMYAGGNPNFDMTGVRPERDQRPKQMAPGLQPGVMPPPRPYDPGSQIATIPNRELPQMAPGYGNAPPSPVYGGGQVEMGPQQFQPSPFAPQPYMGGFSFPFDQTLPAKSEAPMAPAAQGFDSIMPVQQQDTPVQSAPMAPAVYEPMFYAPPPPAPTFYEPPPMAPAFYEPPVMAPFVPSFEPAVFEPQPYIPPMQTYAPEPMPFVPAQIESPFYRPSRDMFVDDFGFEMR